VARSGWAALVAVVALAAAVAGCGSSSAGTKVTKVAIVLPGTLNDVDWTLQSREAFGSIVEKGRLRGAVAEGADVGKIRGILEQLAGEKPQLVIADDSHYAAAATAVAAKTKVPMLVWNDRGAQKPGLVGDIEVDGGPGGYLAGVIAAHSAYTRHLGVVVADDGTPSDLRLWNEMAGGFVAGARSVDPAHVRVDYARVGSGGDAEEVEVHRVSSDMAKHGAQMIFALGGRSAAGVMKTIGIGANEAQYIGVIGDKATINRENVVDTSVMWDFGLAFRRAIADLRAGRFGKQPYTLSIANGGLTMLRTGRTPSDAYAAAEAARRQIIEGKVTVPVTPTEAAVQALIKQG
jgi:basic membrane protein A and related proteins